MAETSLATNTARLRQTRVVVDVRTDSQFMALQELALTQSEICVPLLVGEKLLGVLDLQDTQIRAPSADDLATLRILANQVAVAIDNAQLFSANRKSLESLQRAYGALSSEGWQKVLRAQPELGYHAGAGGAPAPSSGEWSPEMIAARRQEQVVLADDFTLAVPIRIREQPVGVVRLRKPQEAGAWRADEIALVQTLSDRLSTALESARLYEETRRRAERERLTSEITARIRASNDPQTILQTAAHELRKALQADRAQLVIQAAVEETSHDA
jgi:GAF domain-containing protein